MNWYRDMGLIDVLVIGGGAREHALVWKLLLSPKVERVYVAPGNGGTSLLAVPVQFDGGSEASVGLLANWVFQRDIGFTLVGPEVPLANGVVDVFDEMKQPIVGPSREAARLESSKDWAKQFMLRHNIPTAHSRTFDEFEPLRQYLLAEDTVYPLVIKEDALMAGKGVTLAHNRAEAIVWLARIANATLDQVVLADFVPQLPSDTSTPAAVSAEARGTGTAALRQLMQGGDADDILAEAIVKGMTAEQIEAIMRGDEVSRDELMGTLLPSPPAGEADTTSTSEAVSSESATGEASTDTEAEAESQAESTDDPLANDPIYQRLRHDRHELFRREGRKVLVEEYLSGPEVSVLAFTDGKSVKLMPPVCDYKRIGEGDSGAMTGGMGAYSPTKYVDAEALDWIREHVIEAAVQGMAEEGHPYKGILYAGLMMTKDGPKVLEFNARFGDPETQVLMMLLETDLVDICQAIIEERLGELEVQWADKAGVAVVLATPGYPDMPTTGQLIEGLEDIDPDVRVFHAGTRGSTAFTDVVTEMGGGERPSKKKKIDWRTFLGRIEAPSWLTPNDKSAVREITNEGRIELRTSGGRVLTVAATAPTLAEARQLAYRNAGLIHFAGKQLRHDIALRELDDAQIAAFATAYDVANTVPPLPVASAAIEVPSAEVSIAPPSDEPSVEVTSEASSETVSASPALVEQAANAEVASEDDAASSAVELSAAAETSSVPVAEDAAATELDAPASTNEEPADFQLGYSEEQRAEKLAALAQEQQADEPTKS